VKIKAILDTNVLISGLFWKGPPFEILKAWQEQRFRLAISLPILDEYRRVLDELQQMPVLNSLLKVIELRSEMVEPVSFSESVCGDPDDDKFLEAAIAAGADYVVSGDTALLNVKSHHGVEVVRSSRIPGADRSSFSSESSRIPCASRTIGCRHALGFAFHTTIVTTGTGGTENDEHSSRKSSRNDCAWRSPRHTQ